MLGPARASPGPVDTLSPPAGPGATAQLGTPAQAAARPQLRQLPGHQAGTPRRGQRWQRRSQGNSSCWGAHPSAAPAALPPPRFVTVRPRQPEKNSLSFCSRAFKGQDFRCLRELRYLCKKLDGVKLFPGIRGTGRAPSHLRAAGSAAPRHPTAVPSPVVLLGDGHRANIPLFGVSIRVMLACRGHSQQTSQGCALQMPFSLLSVPPHTQRGKIKTVKACQGVCLPHPLTPLGKYRSLS